MIEGVKTLTASRIERRAKPGGAVRYRIGSVAIGVALSTAFALLVSDADPGQFFEGLWNSTFGQPAGFEDMLTLTASLLLVGLAAAIPLKIGLWNIGADGQLFLGAWGAFAMGRLGCTWAATSMSVLGPKYLSGRPLAHHALSDAQDQAALFRALYAEPAHRRDEKDTP